MKTYLVACGIIITLLCSMVSADRVNSEKQSLAENIIAQVRNEYNLDSESAEITVARLDIEKRDISECDVHIYPLTTNSPRGRFPLRIELVRSGEVIAKGSASLNVRLYADLLVPKHQIRRNELLTPDLFTTKRFDVTSITEKMLTDIDDIEGCRAKQNLSAGRYVSENRIEKIPDVENGHQVTIVGRSGLLEIKTKGQALQRGYIGETIKVRNSHSKRIIMGKITAPDVVEVSL